MNTSEEIIHILLRCHQHLALSAADKKTLKSWLKESELHIQLWQDLSMEGLSDKELPANEDKEGAMSLARIRNRVTQICYPSSLSGEGALQSLGDPEIDNGSANAFEATENPTEYEKDISDERLDELLSGH